MALLQHRRSQVQYVISPAGKTLFHSGGSPSMEVHFVTILLTQFHFEIVRIIVKMFYDMSPGHHKMVELLLQAVRICFTLELYHFIFFIVDVTECQL